MKKIIFSLLFCSAVNLSLAQNIGINSTGATPDISAMLDIVAVDKGLLVPRVALTGTTDAVTIATPQTSLLVYNTATAGVSPNNVVPGYYYNSGTTGAPVWTRLATGNGASWLLLGNAGTSAATNFLGTTDNVDMVFRTNNTEKMRVQSGGNVLIGTTTAMSAKVNIVSTAAATSNSTVYIQGPGGTGFGLSGVIDIFDNQATPLRELTLGYAAGAPWYGMIDMFGTSGATEQRMGEFDFSNRTLQPADARIATIVANTPAGVTNSGSLEFITRNAGTFLSNVLWLNYDGKVGIFTRTPGYSLHVKASTAVPNLAEVRVESTDYTKVSFNSSAATANNKKWQMYAVNSVGNELRFGCLNDAETAEVLWLRVFRTGTTPTYVSFPASNVGISTTAPINLLDIPSYNTTNSVARIGQMEFTSYASNNQFLGANVYYSAAGFTRRSAGFISLIYFHDDEIQLRSHPSGAAGTSVGAVTQAHFKSSRTGEFGVGPSISDVTGNFTGSLMYMSAAGDVGIGTITPSAKLEVCGNLKVVGTITAQGAITTDGTITCSSDIRFKKNISPLQNSLETVLNLRGVTYDFKTEEFPERHFSSTQQIGFIAQEIEKYYPGFVVTANDGYKSVDYSRLTPVLVEAVKEQQEIIDRQKAATEQLKMENEAMRNDLEKLKLQVQEILKSQHSTEITER